MLEAVEGRLGYVAVPWLSKRDSAGHLLFAVSYAGRVDQGGNDWRAVDMAMDETEEKVCMEYVR